MKRNDRTGSRLFFIEFLIVLFFFLIVSTVCLRLFARAHMITQHADILSHAQAAASSVAAAVEEAASVSPGETSNYTAEMPVTDIEAASASPDEAASAEISSVESSGGTSSPENADQPLSPSEEELRTDNGADLLARAAEYLPGAFLTSFDDASNSREGLAITYDKNFQICSTEDAEYLLKAIIDTDGHDETLHISVLDWSQTPVYELSVSFHRPVTRKEALL